MAPLEHQYLLFHTWLGSVKQVRMIAAFPQLHQNVEKSHLVGLAGTIDYVNVLHQDLRVPDSDNHTQPPIITDVFVYNL